MLRKIAIPAIILLSILFAFYCSEPESHINGNISGLPDGIVLLNTRNGGMIPIDSAASANGTFTLKTPPGPADIYYLQFVGKGGPDYFLPVILEGNDISITGRFGTYDQINIKGSVANEELKDINTRINAYRVMTEAVSLELRSYADSVSLADSAKYMALATKRDSIYNVISDVRGDFIRTNPASIVAAMFAAGGLNNESSLRDVDSMLNMLSPNIPDNAFIRRLRDRRNQLAKPEQRD